ncbi:nucleotide exchange factor GrpE [Dolosigranulum pigrum]|uniref:nucleotide exchange factor GrpE n=1 Tax=Dolosigranulum pigrum TaxID=29394 RepID=UPI00248C444E|nr:nucleotide exchange factor GrpE [Dolosigranulum pigrum]
MSEELKKEATTQDKSDEPVKEEEAEAQVDESAEETSEASSEQSELVQLQADYDELSDRLIRTQAEMQNIQRRHKRDKEATLKFRAQALAKDIIPAIDNLERALQTEVDTTSAENFKKGVQMVLGSLQAALKQNNIEQVEALGKPFDPTVHEAVAQIPASDGQESGEVIEVLEKGYTLHDRVLRAAKVVVAE